MEQSVWEHSIFLTLVLVAAVCLLGAVLTALANAFVWFMEQCFPEPWSRWIDRMVPGDREYDDPLPGVYDLEERL